MGTRYTSSSGSEATVAFVDLAGFVALTEVHGDERAVALVEEFEGFAAAALGPRDRLVKMLGDAAMFAFVDPAAALAGLRRVIGTCLYAPGFPLPKAGVHHGSVIERSGDVFGRTVNLAARVVSQALGGQVLVTLPTAQVARGAGLAVRPLGPYRLHNLVGPVELYEVDLVPAPAGSSVDPVCRVRVDRARERRSLAHRHGDYRFCSDACAEVFASDPDLYAAPAV